MTTTQHSEHTLEHTIGLDGLVVLRLGHGDVRLRGTDGDRAIVRSPDGEATHGLDVERGDGSLAITTRRDDSVGGPGRGRASSAPLLIDLPAFATVVVEAESADIAVSGLLGEQRYRTASGDVALRDVGGSLTADVVSGDVEVMTVEAAIVALRTVSGDLSLEARTLRALRATTTSGDLRIAGRFEGEGPFRIETVTGDLILSPAGDVRVEMSTITGDIASDIVAHREDSAGHRGLVVGRGLGPTITFRSTSGDLLVTADTDPGTDPGPAPINPAPMAAASLMRANGRPASTAPSAAEPSREHDGDDLVVLRALERGEIDVAEAGRRLAALDDPSAGEARGV